MINLSFKKWLESFRGIKVVTAVPSDIQDRAIDMALYAEALELTQMQKFNYVLKTANVPNLFKNLNVVKDSFRNILLDAAYRSRIQLYSFIDKTLEGDISGGLAKCKDSGIGGKILKSIVSGLFFIPEIFLLTLAKVKIPYYTKSIENEQITKEKEMSTPRLNTIVTEAEKVVAFQKDLVLKLKAESDALENKLQIIFKLLSNMAKELRKPNMNFYAQQHSLRLFGEIQVQLDKMFADLESNIRAVVLPSYKEKISKWVAEQKNAYRMAVDVLGKSVLEQTEKRVAEQKPPLTTKKGTGAINKLLSPVPEVDEKNDYPELAAIPSNNPPATSHLSTEQGSNRSEDFDKAMQMATGYLKKASGKENLTEEEVIFCQAVELEHWSNKKLGR